MIDLDAARAARREAEQEPVEVMFGGETFSLPDELPFVTVELLVSLTGKDPKDMGDVFGSVIRSLLGEEQTEKFFGLHPSFPDVMELINSLMVSYGMPIPESVASAES